MSNNAPPLDRACIHIFSDFDGTITELDTLVFMSKTLGGGPQMVEAIGRLIREGRITLRDGIAAEMRSIRASWDDAVALLREHVRIDAAFPPFAAWCRDEKIPLTILSAGFRNVIELFLAHDDYRHVDIRANRLIPDTGSGWQCRFRDRTEFGHDKAAAIREAQRRGQYAVFIGDGLSDRAPAEVADEVFAKHSLAEYCASKGILCHEYTTFSDVHAELQLRLTAGKTL